MFISIHKYIIKQIHKYGIMYLLYMLNQQQEEQRDAKSLRLVSSVIILNHTLATVHSETEENETYEVDYKKQTCECPDHTFRDVKCGHIRAVNVFLFQLAQRTGVSA